MWPDASVDLFFLCMADRCRSGREYETGNAFLAKTYYQNRVSFAIFALQIDVRRAVLAYVVTLMMNLSTTGAERENPWWRRA